ncbi:heavy-metal-associated domain-containing protein [uncultured Methylobacterium sp.]|uniref:heavy-metal-associated domain-containing protein n=1 Tax=uncultured Methylobacterium sp. TaxID=157278 RepID=UPI0035CA1D8A
MDEGASDLLMRVEGMTCDGCAEAVRRIVRRIDPAAAVEVDRAHERVAIRTRAQSLVVADALTRAGYTAAAMTG